MEWLAFWIIACVIVGIVAGSNGRSGFGYFVLSLFISPVLGGLLVLGLGKSAAATAGADAEGKPTPKTHVRCPDCRELVRMDARKCKHCGTALPPMS